MSAWCAYLSERVGGAADLTFRSANNTVTRFTDDFRAGVLNFTGQHRCCVVEEDRAHMRAGMILVATGVYCDLSGRGPAVHDMDEAVPVVALSRCAKDPRVFGVLSAFEEAGPPLGEEDEMRMREFQIGCIVTSIKKPASEEGRAGRAIVNSAGEGAIWVCTLNGPLRNGDLVVASRVPGVGMRQDDDIVRAHTVAKVTTSSTSLVEEHAEVRVMVASGGIRCELLGCVYKT